MNKIVTLTVNPALDIYTQVKKLEPENKLRCDAPRTEPGGGGINVSRAIHRLGGRSTAIYTRGGYTGNMYSELLENENIDQFPVSIKNNIRQSFAVRETSSGNLYRFGMPGAMLDQKEYEAILNKIEHIRGAEFLVASGSLPPGVPDDFYAAVSRKAKKNNLKFILDTSGKPLGEIVKEGAFLLKPNLEELEDLAGQKAESEKEQKEILLRLLQKYDIDVIVLSRGASGALLATSKQVHAFPAPLVEPVSSVGAGDSMVAGLVYSLVVGKPLQEAVLYGLACGSAALLTPGTDLLYKKDADKLYEELKPMKIK